MPNVYESDVHLPRWKRLVLWLLEDNTGRAVLGVASAVVLIGPIFYLGWWWAITLVAWGAGFAMGHAVARSESRERGKPERL